MIHTRLSFRALGSIMVSVDSMVSKSVSQCYAQMTIVFFFCMMISHTSDAKLAISLFFKSSSCIGVV